MHEIPPEEEKPKPDPLPVRSAERERRQVRLARNVRSRTPSESAKKGINEGCVGCIVLVVVVAILIAVFL